MKYLKGKDTLKKKSKRKPNMAKATRKKPLARRTKSAKAVSPRVGVDHQTVAIVSLPILNPSEVEFLLAEVIEALRTSPRLAELQEVKLGGYWSATWPSAPFEREFTLGQIARMQADALLRKRSFGAAKATAMIFAIRAALGEHD